MSEMLVAGASQVRVGEVMETLTGSAPSPSSVSRVFHTLEAEYEQWKKRQLAQRYGYAFADGTSFSVMDNGQGCKMPILAVVGSGSTAEREMLGFCVGDRENQQAWEDLLEDLKQRGVKEIGLMVSDGHQATMNASGLKFRQAKWQRGVMHKMDNVLSSIPASQRQQLRSERRAIF
jgi:transposase-like protein